MPAAVWWDYIDGIITVDDKTAYRATLELAKKEAIFTGSSGGAAVAAARQVAEGLGEDGLVVTLLPDSGERYLSKFNKDWLTAKGILE
jgi:cystathionine beta-synthase